MKSKPKILYVDDEPMNLELFEANFSSLYEVLTSTDGFVALEILKQNDDLKAVISDLKMPFIDGFDFLERVKEGFPQMKCFLMSGYDHNQQIAKPSKPVCIDHRAPTDRREQVVGRGRASCRSID